MLWYATGLTAFNKWRRLPARERLALYDLATLAWHSEQGIPNTPLAASHFINANQNIVEKIWQLFLAECEERDGFLRLKEQWTGLDKYKQRALQRQAAALNSAENRTQITAEKQSQRALDNLLFNSLDNDAQTETLQTQDLQQRAATSQRASNNYLSNAQEAVTRQISLFTTSGLLETKDLFGHLVQVLNSLHYDSARLSNNYLSNALEAAKLLEVEGLEAKCYELAKKGEFDLLAIAENSLVNQRLVAVSPTTTTANTADIAADETERLLNNYLSNSQFSRLVLFIINIFIYIKFYRVKKENINNSSKHKNYDFSEESPERNSFVSLVQQKTNFALTQQARQVFDFWREQTGKTHARFSDQRKHKIICRLKEGFTVEQLQTAIKGCMQSDFHQGCGEHSDGRVFNDLELICRNATKVENFIEIANQTQARKEAGPLGWLNGSKGARFVFAVTGNRLHAPGTDSPRFQRDVVTTGHWIDERITRKQSAGWPGTDDLLEARDFIAFWQTEKQFNGYPGITTIPRYLDEFLQWQQKRSEQAAQEQVNLERVRMVL